MRRHGHGHDRRISVVVLTHNRPDELLRTLVRLTALPEKPSICIVDNASEPSPQALLTQRYPDLDYLRLPRNIGAAARNRGVERAITPYVAMCDDDTWWEPGSLRCAAEIMDAHPQVGVISARILVGPECRLDPVCVEMARSPLDSSGLPGPALLGFLAGASVVRRDAFLAAGGFRQQFMVGGEEELLALDLASQGWRLVYTPELVVHHHPSPVRNSAARRRNLLRSAVLVSWLRRPLRLALGRTVSLVRASFHDEPARRALFDVCRNAAWLIRSRRRLPDTVEQQLQLLEAWGRER